MKSILKIIVLLLLPVVANAQNSVKERDSLLKALRSAHNDTIRMDINRKLGFYYQDNNASMALPYHNAQLKLAKKLNLKLYEADAYQQIAYCFWLNLNLSESYKYYLQAFKVAEDPKCAANGWGYSNFSYSKSPEEARLSIIAMTHHELSGLYDTTRKYKESKYHLFEALKIGEKLQNQKILSRCTLDVAYLYSYNNKPDSSYLYFQKALNSYKNSPYQQGLGNVYGGLANYFLQKKEYDSAKFYMRKAIVAFEKSSTISNLANSTLDLGRFFIETAQLDSALVYTFKAQKIAKSINDYSAMANGFKQLAKIYKLKNDNALAYDYLIKGKAISDSINERYVEGLYKFQNEDFSQKIRLQELEQESQQIKSQNKMYALLVGLGVFLVVALLLYRNNRQKQKANQVLEKTLSDLKSTQTQLIQSEKMASLGELTAGIAHEIQNPLNFVNNFSEVSNELIEEIEEERAKKQEERDEGLVGEILSDIKQNLEKINHHGKRADAIVKGMLQHSRSSSATKEPTDINKLADEYLRLAYHGLRAKDKSFNATMKTEFDETIGNINIIPQDIGRVILNLITNAFYATNEKQITGIENFEPTVTVATKKLENTIEISVKDNGYGIPQQILDKIFQPFFTTKPTGQGTGLGLSLAYDIVKTHGGELNVETKENEGTTFSIQLPHNHI
jgi:two-component system, NtrC family, sensor kinase